MADSATPRRKPPAAGKGRPKGALNKSTLEARELAASLLDREAYWDSLQERLDAGKLSPAVEALLWHYWKGKPKEQMEVSGPGGAPLAAIARVIVDSGDSDTGD